MALPYRAELHPTKLELLAAWLSARAGTGAQANAIVCAGASFRFDDPESAVAVETMLVRTGSAPIHQVPLTTETHPLHDGNPPSELPLNGR